MDELRILLLGQVLRCGAVRCGVQADVVWSVGDDGVCVLLWRRKESVCCARDRLINRRGVIFQFSCVCCLLCFVFGRKPSKIKTSTDGVCAPMNLKYDDRSVP